MKRIIATPEGAGFANGHPDFRHVLITVRSRETRDHERFWSYRNELSWVARAKADIRRAHDIDSLDMKYYHIWAVY